MPATSLNGAAAPVIDGADPAWVMTTTALVLFMTRPGLALCYGVLPWIILKVLVAPTGLRVGIEDEQVGLDILEHEERGYDL